MKKYRRVEINAYRRRLTIVSGEWRPSDAGEPQVIKIDDDISLDDSETCEPVEPDSPEGQLILIEAVRSLEQRLTPQARATICDGHKLVRNRSTPRRFYSKLRTLFYPDNHGLTRKHNSAVKQSVED